MDVERHDDEAVSRIAAAIGEPARARMLYCLMDGRARTSTELAIVADVALSTASAHLARLRDERLVKVLTQGKHRYYSLEGPDVARALEGLSVLAGGRRLAFAPSTPPALRAARTCYDHMGGTLAVALHDCVLAKGWLAQADGAEGPTYATTDEGEQALKALGVDLEAAQGARRRFAFGCLDWSERRPHVGGALGAALLGVALKRKWVLRELDSRALEITTHGLSELRSRFGISL
jgi:DNA-binding transcriptional ArsR family regulator